MFALQLRTRRSRSLSPVRSPRHVVPRRSRSLGRKPVPVGTKRSYDAAFFDDDDDWIFHPALDPYMKMSKSPSTGASSDGPSLPPKGEMVGGALSPLLNFQLRSVRARRRWRNVLDRQRFQARIQQHRDPTARDDLGNELTSALRRTIRRQIEADSTLTPHSTFQFTIQ